MRERSGLAILVLVVLLAACSSQSQNVGPSDVNVEGTYTGSITATTGGSYTFLLTVSIEAVQPSGYSAEFATVEGTAALSCGEVQNGEFTCAGTQGNQTIEFSGAITSTHWQGRFERREAGRVVVAGNFYLDKVDVDDEPIADEPVPGFNPTGNYEGRLTTTDGNVSRAVVATIEEQTGSGRWSFMLRTKGSATGPLLGDCEQVEVENVDGVLCGATDASGEISLEGSVTTSGSWLGDWSITPALAVTVPGGGDIVIGEPVTHWPDHWPFATSSGTAGGTFVFNLSE